jgi:hypothetical protein
MLPCELLGDSDRSKRRTIADALEILRTKADFGQDDVAEVRLGWLRLPSREVVALVCIGFESRRHQKTFLVSLPSAVSFRGKFQGNAASQAFEIDRLEGAKIDGRGHVLLSNGDQLGAVEVRPALLPYKLTPLDWKIIRQTIAILGIERRCRYRPGSRLPKKGSIRLATQ